MSASGAEWPTSLTRRTRGCDRPASRTATSAIEGGGTGRAVSLAFMTAPDPFGWRDRAIAVAAVGAAAVSRRAFGHDGPGELEALKRQVLVCLALRESLVADPPERTGRTWLSVALRLERSRLDDVVRALAQQALVSVRTDEREHIEYEFALDAKEREIEGEMSVDLTDAGRREVALWLAQVRFQFGSWPPETPNVDDATG